MAMETALALSPLAMAGFSQCVNWGIRKVSKIKKICVILPEKCGKSTLANALTGSHNKFLVDTDEFSVHFDTDHILEKLSKDLTLTEALKSEVHNKTYDYIRNVLKKNKHKQAIFLTSDYQWALTKFKKDAIFCLVPCSEFVKECPGCEPSRSRILHELPKEVVKTFSSWEDLETIVRVKFQLQNPV